MIQSELCPRRVRTAIRSKAALELRLRGLTFREIAEQLGLADKSHARRCVQRALRQISPEASLELLLAQRKAAPTCGYRKLNEPGAEAAA